MRLIRSACTFTSALPLPPGERLRPTMRISDLFKPVRISDNWCWHNAFIQFNICHRIDANDLAIFEA